MKRSAEGVGTERLMPLTLRTRVELPYRGACLLLAVGVAACGAIAPPLDWDTIDQQIADSFPDVPNITTTDLASALSGADRPVVLLDARAPDEYAVSHLRGARLVASADEAAEIVRAAPSDALVVVYCSVGMRSSAMVDQLRAQGVPGALNLEGSIFAWANEGRPVYRGSTAVSEVHPYSDRLLGLLDEKLWPVR